MLCNKMETSKAIFPGTELLYITLLRINAADQQQAKPRVRAQLLKEACKKQAASTDAVPT